jgi:hypothetical protein
MRRKSRQTETDDDRTLFIYNSLEIIWPKSPLSRVRCLSRLMANCIRSTIKGSRENRDLRSCRFRWSCDNLGLSPCRNPHLWNSNEQAGRSPNTVDWAESQDLRVVQYQIKRDLRVPVLVWWGETVRGSENCEIVGGFGS